METDKVEFEVLLPSQTSLRREEDYLSNRLGHSMIACVDADYDFLYEVLPLVRWYVVRPMCCTRGLCHRGICNAMRRQLAHVCVLATLNDLEVMDYEAFFAEFSEIIFPLLVWNVWAYRLVLYTRIFTL